MEKDNSTTSPITCGILRLCLVCHGKKLLWLHPTLNCPRTTYQQRVAFRVMGMWSYTNITSNRLTPALHFLRKWTGRNHVRNASWAKSKIQEASEPSSLTISNLNPSFSLRIPSLSQIYIILSTICKSKTSSRWCRSGRPLYDLLLSGSHGGSLRL